jgi:hypothetical protein
MTIEEIKNCLCIYDERSPDYERATEYGKKQIPCYCDNCFYGKHELANELLKYIERG